MSMRRRRVLLGAIVALVALIGSACSKSSNSNTSGSPGTSGSSGSGKPFVFGMLLVGPYNDHGWSQANYEGGQYVVQQLGGPTKAKMIWLDKVNSSDRPSVKAEDVVTNMIKQGAKLIFATSDDFKDAIIAAAKAHPDVPMIWSSGDSAWQQGQDYQSGVSNLGNYFLKMEYMQEVAGCSAALTTQTGKIGVVGPLINDETRRFVNAAYLGARYCWTTYRNQPATSLGFTVKWIGFWFNIPGTTLDPTQVTRDLFNSGADVVMDHLDTTEALTVTSQLAQSGKHVWAVGYDYKNTCSVAPEICLGVAYFNWGPGYLKIAQSVIDGTFKPAFIWDAPDWSNINSASTSATGFLNGPALSSANAGTLQQFTSGLGDGSIVLFKGPLNWQDGSQYLPDGQVASDAQIWYSPQLLQGITGASKS
jgi:simple sugar transport system substrate-binding protein